jgi:hypothetical protein
MTWERYQLHLVWISYSWPFAAHDHNGTPSYFFSPLRVVFFQALVVLTHVQLLDTKGWSYKVFSHVLMALVYCSLADSRALRIACSSSTKTIGLPEKW